MKLFECIFGKYQGALAAGCLLVFVALGCGGQSDSEWKQTLAGKKLTMASTSGSISDRVDIWFCGSGEYAMKTQFSGYSTGGGGTLSMADEDFEQGRWDISSSTLILQSDGGNTSQYDISTGTDAEVIYLNGKGYLVTTQNECR